MTYAQLVAAKAAYYHQDAITGIVVGLLLTIVALILFSSWLTCDDKYCSDKSDICGFGALIFGIFGLIVLGCGWSGYYTADTKAASEVSMLLLQIVH